MSDAPSSLAALGWDATWAEALSQATSNDSLIPGRVARADRGISTVLIPTPVRATTEHHLPVVGDWVALAPAPGGHVVEAVLPRRSAFVRHRTGKETREQTLAANIDVVFVVAGLDIDPNPRRIERYLTLAWQSGAVPVVVLTKADCCPAFALDDQLTLVRSVAFGVDVRAVSARTGDGVDALVAAHLGEGITAALLGPSGTGKSTLVNRLAGADVMAIAATRSDGKGRHTTTTGQLVPLASGAVLLDTPGLRGVALWEAGEGVAATFVDVEEAARDCRFGDCAHEGEPGCAVRLAVEEGTLMASRVAAWRKLQQELRSLAARQGDRVVQFERRARYKAIAKANRNRDKRRDR